MSRYAPVLPTEFGFPFASQPPRIAGHVHPFVSHEETISSIKQLCKLHQDAGLNKLANVYISPSRVQCLQDYDSLFSSFVRGRAHNRHRVLPLRRSHRLSSRVCLQPKTRHQEYIHAKVKHCTRCYHELCHCSAVDMRNDIKMAQNGAESFMHETQGLHDLVQKS